MCGGCSIAITGKARCAITRNRYNQASRGGHNTDALVARVRYEDIVVAVDEYSRRRIKRREQSGAPVTSSIQLIRTAGPATDHRFH